MILHEKLTASLSSFWIVFGAFSGIIFLTGNQMFLLWTTSVRRRAIPDILIVGLRIAQRQLGIYVTPWLQIRSGVENKDLPCSCAVAPELSMEGIRASAAATVQQSRPRFQPSHCHGPRSIQLHASRDSSARLVE
jgi:hypothetical protein